ncbi:Kelch repeat-containing protein [Streptomyces sp. NPDC002740]
MPRTSPLTAVGGLPAPASAEAAPALAAAGSWAPAVDLPQGGYFALPDPSAVVLGEAYGHRVLIAGGEDAARTAQNGAVLFDPVEKKWQPTGSLSVARRLHTTTKLGDGRVLVAGGLTGPFTRPFAPLSSAEIYDPGTKTWRTTNGALHEARFSHSATLLGDGRVLVTGGLVPRDALTEMSLSSAEIYDPLKDEWTQVPSMHDARSGHPTVALDRGRILVVGGILTVGRGLYTALAFCEVYDPAAGPNGTWTPTGSLQVPRKAHQATRLGDGSVLVTGGDSTGALQDWTYNAYSQWVTERYNPANGAWSEVEPMSAGRSHHRAVALRSGKVLVIGGTEDATFDVGYQNAEIYDPSAGPQGTWTPTGGMVTGRWAGAAAELEDGRVLAAGGLIRSGAATPDSADMVTAASELFTV